jgi:hypothetical protein
MIFEGAVKYYEMYATFPLMGTTKVFVGYSAGIVKVTKDAFYYPTYAGTFTYQENGIKRTVNYPLSSDGKVGYNLSSALSVEFKQMQCAFDSDTASWLEPVAI